jgi:hypothetical protein
MPPDDPHGCMGNSLGRGARYLHEHVHRLRQKLGDQPERNLWRATQCAVTRRLGAATVDRGALRGLAGDSGRAWGRKRPWVRLRVCPRSAAQSGSVGTTRRARRRFRGNCCIRTACEDVSSTTETSGLSPDRPECAWLRAWVLRARGCGSPGSRLCTWR